MHHKLLPLIVVTITILCVSLPCLKAQGSGFDILAIGPSTEALSINEATTAYLLGASDIYTNPANLAFEPSSSLNADYSLWIGDLTNTHVAANFRRNNSAISFGLLASEAGDFELRDRPGPSQGSFSVSYLSITGGYAYKLRNFSAGASLQYLREELYIFNASGYAVNAGISSRWLDEKLYVSAALQNLGDMENLNNEPTSLPTLLRGGFYAQILKFAPKNDKAFPVTISLVSDLVHSLQDIGEDSSTSPTDTYLNVGLIVDVSDFISVRGGYKTGDTGRPLSLGAGIQINNITTNYALIPFETGFGTVHSVGISYNF